MRQSIYEVMGAESGATLTEYGMFADICVGAAEYAAALFGIRWNRKFGRAIGTSDNSLNLIKD
jgi:hypothetical protein